MFKRRNFPVEFMKSTSSSTKSKWELSLQRIAVDIVDILGYSGSMIAIWENDGELPVYAFYIDPNIASIDIIKGWEQKISRIIKREISLSDPQVARVNVYKEEHRDNLSVQAIIERRPKTSYNLLDLFVPIIPANLFTKRTVKNIQRQLEIKEVVAIPLSFDPLDDRGSFIVGNLFAAKSSVIAEQDIQILTSFGREAAIIIAQASATIAIEQRDQAIRNFPIELQKRIKNEEQVLQLIAENTVDVLGNVGAMVATYEADDDSLPVRAFYIDPKLVTMEKIASWEALISKLVGEKVSISNPAIAKIYVNKPGYEENLSIQAIRQHRPVFSNELLTLFTPIVPSNAITRSIVNSSIQKELNVTQVAAIPFIFQSPDERFPQIVGNLFAATTHPEGYQKENIEQLITFSQQAAASIFNARLYRYTDEQRQAAQTLSMMTFNTSKSIHQFKNHLGFIRGQLQLLPHIDQMPDQLRHETLSSTPQIIERLDILSQLLENLHEPWQPINISPTNVNDCLRNARDEIIPEHSSENIKVELDLAETLPLIETSPNMLSEAFGILIKNAKEAIEAQGGTHGHIRIVSRLHEKSLIVQIEDNGTGIKPEDIRKVFKLHWSTKKYGLGFGLFWAKDYIEGLGGKIWVESVWQQKSIFYVELPFDITG